MNVVEMKNIRKTYGSGKNEVQALNIKGLTIKKGEFLSIEGPSGCGKSTLVHIMGLLDTPTSGKLMLAGRDTAGLSESGRAKLRNKHLGFVFQKFNLLPDLNVYKNVALPLAPTKLSKKERHARVTELLERVGLSDRANHLPSELSGGEQQRVAIARALVNQPDLIIADEPTGNLDRKSADEVMQLIHDMRDKYGSTVVIVTHDPEISKHADRVLRNAVTK
jgi:putative ABC transport system ATP-binding protein